MNQTHIHLLITHLPIFGSLLGCFVLAYGMWTKTLQTIVASYYVFVFSAVGAGVAYLTGEAAEETAENLAGVVTNSIEQHEEFAVLALVSSIILGVASIVASYLTSRKKENIYTVAFAILFLALVNFGLAGRTGYLGGQIRHTEITTDAVAPAEGQEIEDED